MYVPVLSVVFHRKVFLGRVPGKEGVCEFIFNDDYQHIA